MLLLQEKKYCLKVKRFDKETSEQNDILVEANLIAKLNTKSDELDIPKVYLIDPENRFYVYDFFEGESLKKYQNKDDETMKSYSLILEYFMQSLIV